MKEFDGELLERALRLSAAAHGGQFRKGGELPYFSHPAAVALILARAGFHDEEILAAALLHDVVEDTSVEIADLESGFPARVCEYVAAASEEKLDGSGRKRGWKERKADHVRQVSSAAQAARAIVLADKLHNLQSMLYDLTERKPLWGRFNASREQVIDYHRRMIAAAAGTDDELRSLAEQASALLAQIASFPDES